jgi:hypothetical protein
MQRMMSLTFEFVLAGSLVASVAAKCETTADCNMAGVCSSSGECMCDAGWRHGPDRTCEHLDLLPQRAPSAGAAWPPSGRSSSNSSWCIAPHREAGRNGTNDTYHIFVSELSPGCGLSTWLPGSHIIHATAPTPTGPFTLQDQVMPTFHHNPHITVAADGTYLLYFNGRMFPANDVQNCELNATGPVPYHGGGNCTNHADCIAAGGPTNGAHSANKCTDGKCACEHHFWGLHCEKLVETVNLLTSRSLSGPWSQLLPDGAPFFTDGVSSLAMSAVSGWPLANGSVVLAYCRAPDLGIAIAPHWKGPYRRLSLPGPGGAKNYSLVAPLGGRYNSKGSEGPFLWRDKRGTWRMIFHGYGESAGWSMNITETAMKACLLLMPLAFNELSASNSSAGTNGSNVCLCGD